tara:strand:+ start:840 stop:1172 length:333 start_codon:yes stop_codon:yes gene_type:complete
MAKYNNTKVDFTFYISKDDIRQEITNLTDPAPTIFEDMSTVEIRFNVQLDDQASFLKYHALNQYEGKNITVGMIYDNGVELKTTFTVTHYERRFGSNKGAIVTHVFKGEK